MRGPTWQAAGDILLTGCGDVHSWHEQFFFRQQSGRCQQFTRIRPQQPGLVCFAYAYLTLNAFHTELRPNHHHLSAFPGTLVDIGQNSKSPESKPRNRLWVCRCQFWYADLTGSPYGGATVIDFSTSTFNGPTQVSNSLLDVAAASFFSMHIMYIMRFSLHITV